MKAVLVVDVDDMIGEVDYTVLSKKEMVNGRAKLRPLPHKKEPKEEWFNEYHRDEFADGFNFCLDVITGETE